MINLILLLIIYIGIYSILSLSLNLIAGYTGLLSLCHAAFFAIGSYATAILMLKFNTSFWIALILSGFISSIFGIFIGLPTLRLKGDYLAIATLGFGEIVRNVILNWDSLTNGPMGVHGIPAPMIFGFKINPTQKWQYLMIIWLFVFLTYFLIRRIINSRFGRALEAIREDEISASAIGINTTKYKIVSFSIGAFFAGIAGSFWAIYNQSVSPGTFTFMLSVMILCMVVLGGMGNHLAVVFGAFIIVIADRLPLLLNISGKIPAEVSKIFFGLILVFMMIYRPQGILGRKKMDFEKIMIKYSFKER